ncbi:3-oxoadipate enol-lactonase [Trinickia symbiotica]|uniref:3-oxoadipate enol-lactonase n=1 Tax=Trinickia symbiotica TaxID=863227 RepID=A0A2T3Y1L5_9BURK|nr:3-oxoadipate enol-lactonase [Trinickia symbiotica]PTB22674.1 3-oxoadipate enol-lactonase [Trinickia symbiotica]
MPYINANDISLYYRIDGAQRADAPWLVLSNALGTDVALWSPQIDTLSRTFRVLRYDTRGLGRSSAPAGPYTIEQLSADVLALLDALGIERAHFCGVSLGGATGMALAARHGERIDRLISVSAPPRNPTSAEIWAERMKQARGGSMPALADAVIARWFSAAFVAREPLVCAAIRDMIRHTDPEGYAGNCAAVASTDLTAELARIEAPTLILTGTHDAAIAPEAGRALAASIAGARHVELDALHLPNVEQADAFTRAVLSFLNEPRPAASGG